MSNMTMFVTKRNGIQEPIKFDKITARIHKLLNTNEQDKVDPILITQKVVATIYSGITTSELDLQSAEICVNLSTVNPFYSNLAGRILVSNLHKNTTNHFVEKMVKINTTLNILDEKWLTYIKKNKKEINAMIDYERDYTFDYFGFKTLERAYLLKIKDDIIERPQDMYMRVASFLNQGNLENIKKTYDLISNGFYTHATPTLFNAGNKRSQLSSCFLIGTDDSLEGITHTWESVSKISKWGGGIGLHVSNIRAKDSLIKGTNGPSSGIIPMLKVYNEIARYINQCFTGEVKVYTNKGLVPIENIKPNDKVFTNDGSLQEVEKIYCDKYDKKILNIGITHDYENIKVTPQHPFYVVKNQPPGTNFKLILNRLTKGFIKPEWVDAKDITKNDLIGFPIPKYTLDNPDIDEADCYVYGLMLGDGHICINRNETGITLGFKKDYSFEFVKKYLTQLGIHYWITTNESTNAIKWTPTSKFKFVRSQFYNDNKEKQFDPMMLNLPENKIKYIIKGILDTDGSIGKEITLEMTSQNIIDGVKYMLLRMGILTSGYYRDRVGNISTYKNIETKKPTFVLRIPKVTKIAELLEIDKAMFLKYLEYNGILYTRIKEVTEEDADTLVYDLEVKNNHNYLTQGGLVHNGGKRKGSIAIYLEPWHPDILAFLELKKNFGAETERARDLFLALWIPDLFMKRVEEDGLWYTMCPDECPGLTDSWGDKFEELYNKYVSEGKYRQKLEARKVMKAILESQLETGTPYVLYKDTANKKSNQQNLGTIKSSNLCVHEDTKILTERGYKKIKLLENKKIKVWNGTEWSKVEVKKTGTNKNLVRVNLSNGAFLDCTPEHKFYIQKGYKPKEIIETPAMNLKVDDNLIKYELPPAIEFDKPEEFKYAYTHGAFCGDGTYGNGPLKHPKLYLYGEKKDLLEHINHTSYTINDKCDRYNIILPKDLNPKFKVPFKSSINDRLRWFEGYSDTDGSIARNGTNESLQICSINKEFLLNVRLMLHTLSIQSKVAIAREPETRLLPDGKGGKAEFNCKKLYRLLVSSCELYKLSQLGFKPKRLTFEIREPQRDANQFVKVVSVEESYQNVDTFCFTEPLKHMGVFNGILTGQCAEILLYSDSKEYAVCNLASIAINTCVKPFSQEEGQKFIIPKNSKNIKQLLKNNNLEYEEADDTTVVKYKDLEFTTQLELYNFIKSTFDYEKLEEVAYMSTMNLDRVIDVNYYPTIETKLSNMKHRPIGVGIQGLADALVMLKIPFDSEESIVFNAKLMESLYYGCAKASVDIAKSRHDKMKQLIEAKITAPEYYCATHNLVDKELNKLYHELMPCKYELERNTKYYGSYSSFDGSPFSRGLLQFDLWNVTPTQTEKWDELKKELQIYGARNSQLTALMPTATTSQILGNNECFEFFTNNIYTRRTLAGDFPLVNKYLVDDLIALGLWSSEMKDLILSYNGSIAEINLIPEQIKKLYPTVWEIKQSWVLKNALARGPYVDQTQSMNIFMPIPDYQKLFSSHMWAWKNGLKTGIYYLRSKPSQDATKFTVDPNIQKNNKALNNETIKPVPIINEKRFKKPEENEVCDTCSS